MHAIQAQLGHSSFATTSIYLQHVAPAELVKAMRSRPAIQRLESGSTLRGYPGQLGCEMTHWRFTVGAGAQHSSACSGAAHMPTQPGCAWRRSASRVFPGGPRPMESGLEGRGCQ